MWSASIKSVVADEVPGIVDVIITYKNSDGSVSQDVIERISDPNSIPVIVNNGLGARNHVDAIASGLENLLSNPPLGPVLPPTPPVVDTDLANFQKTIPTIQLISQLKQLGWITGDEDFVVATQTQIMALVPTNLPKLLS
jgi:hypothetical protein